MWVDMSFLCIFGLFVFFFKQKTAYDMRISDWSSDVCSSDLQHLTAGGALGDHPLDAADLTFDTSEPDDELIARVGHPRGGHRTLGEFNHAAIVRRGGRGAIGRSDASREGQEWVSKGRFGGSRYDYQKNKITVHIYTENN